MSSKNYVDIKHTIWQRYYFKDDANMEEVAQALLDGEDVATDDSLGYKETEDLCETLETLTIRENKYQPTIEVYKNEEMIWDNKMKKVQNGPKGFRNRMLKYLREAPRDTEIVEDDMIREIYKCVNITPSIRSSFRTTKAFVGNILGVKANLVTKGSKVLTIKNIK